MNLRKLVLFAFLAFTAVNAFSKAKEPYKVEIQESVKLNKFNKKLGYQLINAGETVCFIFDAKTWEIERPQRVHIEGSFNGWAKKLGAWEMAKIKDNLFMLEAAKIDVQVPGNSGHPEFRFVVTAEVPYTETVCGKELTRYKTEIFETEAKNIPGYKLLDNSLIIFPEDDVNSIIQAEASLKKEKKLKEFNLSKEEDIASISNFRQVPGTSALYRGYHPYKISRANLDTEESRINLVRKQLREKGIKSIITLSGDETLVDGKEQLPVFITDIRKSGNQLFIETKYNTVYYNSESKDFGNMIAEIVRFINSHEGPYYVHCRLGTDRTGVVSAMLAAFSGAKWSDIAKDYQKSNDMGIKEYRDSGLLKYSMERIIGMEINDETDLQKALSQYFVDRAFLTRDEINTLVKKLNP